MREEAEPATEAADEPKGGRPGPSDHGGSGGMATRENSDTGVADE